MIYLDYAATTPLSLEARRFLRCCLGQIAECGNPSSSHDAGLSSTGLMLKGIKAISETINCDPSEIYATSGGTESDNWALRGILKPGDHLITTAIEHSAILETCHRLEKDGIEVTYIKPNCDGIVELTDFAKAKKDNTKLVSVMLVNNETGMIQPVKYIAQWAKSLGLLVHTDATQALGHLPVNIRELGVDLLSGSAHKFGGLIGNGFLYVRNGVAIEPIIYGGNQQDGLRAGTENYLGIYVMGNALSDSSYEYNHHFFTCVQSLEQQLLDGLLGINGVHLNGHHHEKSPSITNVYVEGVDAQALVEVMNQSGFCISTGSACHSGEKKPSHVLKAMGYSDERSMQSIRISIGWRTRDYEIEKFIEVLKYNIDLIRKTNKGE